MSSKLPSGVNKRPYEAKKQKMSKKRRLDDGAEKPRAKPKLRTKLRHLDDLINLTEDVIEYRNIQYDKLRAILPYVKKLNNMVGMADIKNIVFGQILYHLQGMQSGDEFLHTVIMGAPGSGKTTLAEILSNIYCHLGLISTGKVHKVHKKDLISKWCGETAVFTEAAVKAAFGGVLLIDEAYSLSSNPDKADAFSKECIDTLCSCLSEYRKDFICIIVGYKESLENCFFKLNPGLERRFAWRFNTGTTVSLDSIFIKQAEQLGWKIAADAIPAEFFTENNKLFQAGGGDTELLFAKCKIEYAKRMFGNYNSNSKHVITKDDFRDGFNEFKNNKPQIIASEPPPFGLYL
ncbi:ESX-1 secretion system protein [Pacmanvirus S19]|nr:ESX-1 secretion system protein [Pacmanvirus S19]